MNEREREREEENNLQAAAKSIKINEMQSRFYLCAYKNNV